MYLFELNEKRIRKLIHSVSQWEDCIWILFTSLVFMLSGYHAQWLRSVLWELLNCAPLSPQEDGFTGFMRNLRGRDQEKVVKRKEELWGGRTGRGRCTAQFVIALWPLTLPRALSALTWETWWPQWKAIFLYHGNHVCNNANRVPTVRPTTLDFFFHGYTDGQNTVTPLFFGPNTVTAYDKSYTLYRIYAILTPAEPCEGSVWLVDTHGGGLH